uniref:Uncharacterized protein n=1 Tax=Molossus molossus TaxID=27622 RepID=A0A7J8HCN8_MOLMO|nr:hypothetical protein HJG59_011092 [Molossus molossus]
MKPLGPRQELTSSSGTGVVGRGGVRLREGPQPPRSILRTHVDGGWGRLGPCRRSSQGRQGGGREERRCPPQGGWMEEPGSRHLTCPSFPTCDTGARRLLHLMEGGTEVCKGQVISQSVPNSEFPLRVRGTVHPTARVGNLGSPRRLLASAHGTNPGGEPGTSRRSPSPSCPAPWSGSPWTFPAGS